MNSWDSALARADRGRDGSPQPSVRSASCLSLRRRLGDCGNPRMSRDPIRRGFDPKISVHQRRSAVNDGSDSGFKGSRDSDVHSKPFQSARASALPTSILLYERLKQIDYATNPPKDYPTIPKCSIIPGWALPCIHDGLEWIRRACR